MCTCVHVCVLASYVPASVCVVAAKGSAVNCPGVNAPVEWTGDGADHAVVCGASEKFNKLLLSLTGRCWGDAGRSEEFSYCVLCAVQCNVLQCPAYCVRCIYVLLYCVLWTVDYGLYYLLRIGDGIIDE